MTIRKLIKRIKRKLGIREQYPSETSKVRHLVIGYCEGYGCDIGFGGDKIKKTDCIGIDYLQPYAHTGKDQVDIACDVMNEPVPVPDNSFDYVYTSHLIEDFADTTAALKEFIRILRPGGNLILVFPDQQVYEGWCRRTGQTLNTHHIHADMGLALMKQRLTEVTNVSLSTLYESNCHLDYNVILVAKISSK
jgi:predicted SAM-dependent methyltransferase